MLTMLGFTEHISAVGELTLPVAATTCNSRPMPQTGGPAGCKYNAATSASILPDHSSIPPGGGVAKSSTSSAKAKAGISPLPGGG